MDSDTRCTGRLLQTSVTPPLPHLRPPLPPAQTLLAVAPICRVRGGPPHSWRDAAGHLGPASVAHSAARLLGQVAPGDQRLVRNRGRAPRAEQLQPPPGRRAQEKALLLPEVLPSHRQEGEGQRHQERGRPQQCAGDQVGGRGGGGHQEPGQQLLPGHQQEGGALRSEGLWSRLPPDRTHRGEQVQHLRLGGVAQQEEAHVRGAERQRKTDEGEENPPEKHGHTLSAHRGATPMTRTGRVRTHGGWGGYIGQTRAGSGRCTEETRGTPRLRF